MWPFSKKQNTSKSITATVEQVDGLYKIDVTGQTCPGYLLAINREVEKLPLGSKAQLLITYPPCGDDVKAWCKEKNISFVSMEQKTDLWIISIQK